MSIDDDGSVCKTIELIYNKYKFAGVQNVIQNEFIFAKGGNRFAYEIPEKNICDKLGIEIKDGLGKKIQSSTELVEKARKFKK